MEETLGKRIVSNRKRLGMTQDRLAELLGVTAQAVSKWENDQSCPDISTLPKLAQIFGITTDELLGSKCAVETTVEPSAEEEPEHTVELNLGMGKKFMLCAALWLMISGGVSLYAGMKEMDVSTWTVLWSAGLLSFGLFGLWPDFSVFRLGCAAAGGYFLAGAFFPLPGVGWPVILLVLGLLLLIGALQKRPAHSFKMNVKGENSSCRTEGEHFQCETSFGEKTNRITLPRLSSGNAEVSFGKLTVDLSGCKEIIDGAQVKLDCSFGELELLVPRSCRVVCGVGTAFGEFSVDGQPHEDAAVTLYVNGQVSFGEGCVRYL